MAVTQDTSGGVHSSLSCLVMNLSKGKRRVVVSSGLHPQRSGALPYPTAQDQGPRTGPPFLHSDPRYSHHSSDRAPRLRGVDAVALQKPGWDGPLEETEAALGGLSIKPWGQAEGLGGLARHRERDALLHLLHSPSARHMTTLGLRQCCRDPPS